MTVMRRYSAALRPQYVLGVTDLLAKAMATRGPLPAPTCALDCVLVAQAAPAARRFVPPVFLVVRQGDNGTLTLDGRHRVGDGPVREQEIAAGTYDAELRGEHYRPLPFSFSWPPAALRTPLDAAGVPVDLGLLPGPAYPYPELTAVPFGLGPTLLRGAVFTAAGEPVRDATVRAIGLPPLAPPNPAWPFLETRTGANGDWALVLPDRRRIGFPAETTAPPPQALTIRVTHPNGGPVVDIAGVAVTLGRENAVPNTALRGLVLRNGMPVSGVRIRNSVNALESRTGAGGAWSLYLDPNQPDVANVTLTATAPDGGSATVGTVIRGRATVVAPTIHLT